MKGSRKARFDVIMPAPNGPFEDDVSLVIPLIRSLALGCLLAGLVVAAVTLGFRASIASMWNRAMVIEEMVEQLRPGLNVGRCATLWARR